MTQCVSGTYPASVSIMMDHTVVASCYDGCRYKLVYVLHVALISETCLDIVAGFLETFPAYTVASAILFKFGGEKVL